MLNKLLKYEITATARIFLPLYAVLLVYSVIHRIISVLSDNNWQAPEVISLILYIMILVGIFVATLVVMIQRFYKNLLSDEGYLMFTLPVKPWQHIVSKLLTSMMWLVLSSIAAIISIFIIAFEEITNSVEIHIISSNIAQYFSLFGVRGVLFIVEMILAGIVSLASYVLIIYASIAIGHLFNRHRVLASLGAFIVLNTASQIFFTVIGIITGNVFGKYFTAYDVNTVPDFHTFEPFVHLVFCYGIIVFGLLAAGYFLITKYILDKRLNLE